MNKIERDNLRKLGTFEGISIVADGVMIDRPKLIALIDAADREDIYRNALVEIYERHHELAKSIATEALTLGAKVGGD